MLRYIVINDNKKTINEIKTLIETNRGQLIDTGKHIFPKDGNIGHIFAIVGIDWYDIVALDDILHARGYKTYINIPGKCDAFYKGITSDKKANAAYWDSLDTAAEKFITSLLEESFDINHNNISINRDDRIYIAKRVIETVAAEFKKIGLDFPYVDGDL